MIILNSALGRVDYVDQVVPDPEKFLKALLQEIPFASEQIMMFGKKGIDGDLYKRCVS